jgi:hypothetical protein
MPGFSINKSYKNIVKPKVVKIGSGVSRATGATGPIGPVKQTKPNKPKNLGLSIKHSETAIEDYY